RDAMISERRVRTRTQGGVAGVGAYNHRPYADTWQNNLSILLPPVMKCVLRMLDVKATQHGDDLGSRHQDRSITLHGAEVGRAIVIIDCVVRRRRCGTNAF